jgi:anti-repressor protein
VSIQAIVPFTFRDHEVRTVTLGSEPWFVAADVCRVLEILNPTDALKRLDDDERVVISNDGSPLDGESTPSLKLGVTLNAVNEPGLYSLILGSRKPQAKAFKRWVTHEVIPSIRRTGSYGAVAALSRSDLARMVLAQEEEKAQLAAKVEADAPKVLFADAVSVADTSILVGDLAKILRGNGVEIGANRLFARLREDGYLIRRQGSDWNMPTQKAMELGLFKIKETAVTHSDGHVTVSKTPKVTGRGQAYFVNRYAGRAAAA